MNVRYFFVTDRLKAGDVTRVVYKPTDLMESDFLTKALMGKNFQAHRETLMGLKGIDVYQFYNEYKKLQNGRWIFISPGLKLTFTFILYLHVHVKECVGNPWLFMKWLDWIMACQGLSESCRYQRPYVCGIFLLHTYIITYVWSIDINCHQFKWYAHN